MMAPDLHINHPTIGFYANHTCPRGEGEMMRGAFVVLPLLLGQRHHYSVLCMGCHSWILASCVSYSVLAMDPQKKREGESV